MKVRLIRKYSIRKEKNKVLVKINEGHDSNQVLSHFINNKHNIVSYNELLPSLNDIFIKLVESTHATTRAFQNIS
jgi:ABC-2 type transport system ATP-binding protein